MTEQATALDEKAAQTTPAPEAQAQPAAAPADAGSPPKQETPAAAEFKWADDWTSRMARSDEAKAKRLARYASPEAVADALFEAQSKISSSGLKTPFPADADDATKNRWRADNGIPESYDAYELNLSDGVVIGEEDKPIVDGFLKVAHSKNMAPDAVNEAVNWYYGEQMRLAQERAAAEGEHRANAEKEMIAEWGNNYIAEKKSIVNFLQTQGLTDLAQAVGPDGVRMGNNPAFLRAMSALARELNPGATVVPGASNASATIAQEMAAIEKTMGTTKYTDDPAIQRRYLELTEAKQKIDARK